MCLLGVVSEGASVLSPSPSFNANGPKTEPSILSYQSYYPVVNFIGPPRPRDDDV